MKTVALSAVVGAVLFGLVGCSQAPATALNSDECKGVQAQPEPDLMAWDPSSRGALAGIRQQGVAVVRYEGQGCDVHLELLSNCIARGEYQFVPYWESETKIARNVKELFSTLPVGAVNLTGKLRDNHALRTDYMLAGMAQIPIGANYEVSDLVGDCSRATHLVTRMYLGGFALAGGDSQQLEASTSVFVFSAGGKSESSLDRVQRAGDAESCLASKQSGKENGGCAVPLRLTLLPLVRAHECLNIQDCDAGCNAGSARDCNASGIMRAEGREGPPDMPAAVVAFRKACEGGNPGGCGNLGLNYLHGDGITQDFRHASQLLDQACRRGVPWACSAYASMITQGQGQPVDLVAASQLYQQACAGGDEPGCKSSVNILQELCDGGNGHSCLELAALYMNGQGFPVDMNKGVAAVDKGCATRDVDSCIQKASFLIRGTGGIRAPEQGLALLEQICSSGEARGCSALGATYAGLNGDGVPRDDKRAFKLLDGACDLGDQNGCVMLAGMYGEGRGTTKDMAHAVSLARDACDSGHPAACGMLASAYEDGDGVPADLAKARALYQKSCQGGYTDSCRALERLGK